MMHLQYKVPHVIGKLKGAVDTPWVLMGHCIQEQC